MTAELVTEDPRVGRTKAAAMQAALDLVAEEGACAVTHQRVAKRARMSRATLYRHWPQPEDLLFDTLAQVVTKFELAGTGRLRDELVAELERNRRDLNQPLVKIVFTTVIQRAPQDPGAALLRDRFIGNLTDSLRHSIEAATARGELRPGLKADVLSAQTMGALMYRRFIEDRTVTRAFVEEVVHRALCEWEL